MSQQASLRHHTTQPTSPEAPLHNFTPHWTLPKIDNGPKCRLCGIAGSDQCQDFLLQLRAAVEAAAQPAASGSTGATALVLSLRRLQSPPTPRRPVFRRRSTATPGVRGRLPSAAEDSSSPRSSPHLGGGMAMPYL